MRTVAIDFDGVIHKYSKEWHDGTCYDKPNEGALEYILYLMEDHAVFIFSTRNPRDIKKWVEDNFLPFWDGTPCTPYSVEVIPFWRKFWNKKNVLGITRRKLPALAYIDDRAIPFTGSFKDLPTKF